MEKRDASTHDTKNLNFLGQRDWCPQRAAYDLLREHPFVLWLQSTLVSFEEEDDSAFLFSLLQSSWGSFAETRFPLVYGVGGRGLSGAEEEVVSWVVTARRLPIIYLYTA